MDLKMLRKLPGIALVVASAALSARATTIEYYHVDALGSVRLVTDEAGSVLERHDFLPFGEECTTGPCASNPGAGAGQPRKFTGKERDTETGLDYFGARYYGSKTGRFTTVDPVYTWQENILDPQKWNRYAYARNNPLRYVDPDGRAVKDNGDPYTIAAIAAARKASPSTNAIIEIFEGSSEKTLEFRAGAIPDQPGVRVLGNTDTMGYETARPTSFVVTLDKNDIERTPKTSAAGVLIHEVVGHVFANMDRTVGETLKIDHARRERDAQERTAREYQRIPRDQRPPLPPGHILPADTPQAKSSKEK